MKLTAFHAGDGDCLLLSSNGKHVLIDGGRTASFNEYTKPALVKIREDGQRLDVVYVSHIDDDHITGVLTLVEDIVAWKAAAFARSIDPDAPTPEFEPPEIGEVWHNGLFVLVGDQLAPQVQPVLATTAMVLAGSSSEDIRDLASQLNDLVTGEKASMELSRRLSPEQLGIEINPATKGALLKRAPSGKPAHPGEVMAVDTMTFYLLGPSDDDIEKLRKKWSGWLKTNKTALKKLQTSMLEDEQRIGALQPDFVANPIETDLGDGLETITEANLASLMFLVEEGGKTILLTGDGVSSEILEGLARHDKLAVADGKKRIHVDVLKVQHHGAEGNVTPEFVNAVTADHYVFCGNGAHSNPEVSVIEGFAKARVLLEKDRAFKFWFTSSSSTPGLTKERQEHMEKLEKLVASLKKEPKLKDRFEAEFLDEGSFAIYL